MFDKKGIIVGFISAVIMFFTAFFAGLYLVSDPMLNQMVTFDLTAQSIAEAYPGPFSTGNALRNAEKSLLNLLDPFSFRLSRQEFRNMMEESTGKYSGIGITVVARDTALMVITVREGGPAAAVGIISGDYIIRVGDLWVPVDDPLATVDKIRGPNGTQIDMTLYRPATGDTLQVTLTRRDIKLEHLPYYGMTIDNIAYIRMADFESGAATDLEKAIKELEVNKPVGYIIDLNSNPGGYLDEAIKAADLFMHNGELVVGIDARSRWDCSRFYSSSDPITEAPVVVLTDRGTASAAEIFSGSLRGADRAIVVGDTTFGKGLVQTLFSMGGGEAIRLTTSRYYFADGRYLNPPDSQLAFVGLTPDIVFREKGEAAFMGEFLTGFLVYDFTEQYWDLLSSYPVEFGYPDTVLQLFADYAMARGHEYKSLLTKTVNLIQTAFEFEPVSKKVSRHLGSILKKSQDYDRGAFARHGDLIKYYVKRIVLERQNGTEAIYIKAIIPYRRDVQLATEILLDRDRYREILSGVGEISSIEGGDQ